MSSAPRRLTYANVVSTLALVVALGGGGAAVAAGLAKNSVGSPQIKNGQVTAADLAGNSVTSAKIKDGQVTGKDVKESSLATVPSANRAMNLMSATVESDGTLVTGQSLSAVSSLRHTTGEYKVFFNRNVSGCTYVATPGTPGVGMVSFAGDAIVTSTAETNGVAVVTYTGEGNPIDRSFMVAVIC